VVLDTPKFLGIKPELSGPVLYLDWEADSVTHAMRLEALCKAKGLRMIEGIHYMPMASSLYLSQRRVMSAVADLHPVLLIVDSNAMARGATGEGGAEDSTIRMITALRSFGPAALVVDHKSEEKIRRGLTGGYGSIFNRNLARLEWEVVRTNRTLEATSLALRLEKANNIRTKVELGFRFEIAANGHGIWNTANIAPVDPSSIISFDPSDNTAASKIYNYLRTRPRPSQSRRSPRAPAFGTRRCECRSSGTTALRTWAPRPRVCGGPSTRTLTRATRTVSPTPTKKACAARKSP
jgi:hypothetical protein